MIDIVGLESIGKYIIWLWSKYVKRKHIPYMDLEFHYPNYLFIVLGSIVCAIILGIAIAYFSIKLNKEMTPIAILDADFQSGQNQESGSG